MSNIRIPHQIDVEGLRSNLRNMNDTELVRFGTAARYMCSLSANKRRRPREEFLVQVREARAEWRRRHSPPGR